MQIIAYLYNRPYTSILEMCRTYIKQCDKKILYHVSIKSGITKSYSAKKKKYIVSKMSVNAG